MADTRYKVREFAHLPHVFPAASQTDDGMMSAADKAKLDGIPAGGGAAIEYPNFAAFPNPLTVPGAFAIDLSTGGLWCATQGAWCFVTVLTPP
jgi:hypothetical protein